MESILKILILFLFITCIANSQWQRLDVPDVGPVSGLAHAGTEQYLFTPSLGVWKFDAATQSWSEDNNGIMNLNITVMKGSDDYIVAGGHYGIWIRKLGESKYNRYVGGSSFAPTAIEIVDDTIYAAIENRIFRLLMSSISPTWSQFKIIPGTTINELHYTDDGSLYVASDDGLFRLNIPAQTIDTLPLPDVAMNRRVTDVAMFGDRLFASIYGLFCYTDNKGATWTVPPDTCQWRYNSNLDVSTSGKIALYSKYGGRPWLSIDNGETFTEISPLVDPNFSLISLHFNHDDSLWAAFPVGPANLNRAQDAALVVKGLEISTTRMLGEYDDDYLAWIDHSGIVAVDKLSYQQTRVVSEEYSMSIAEDVVMSNSGVGVVCGYGNPLFSNDTGRTWVEAESAPRQAMRAIVNKDGSVLVVASDHRVYKVDAMGWSAITDSCSEYLWHIIMDDDGNIYSAQSSNIIWFWSKELGTWEQLSYKSSAKYYTGIGMSKQGNILLCSASGMFEYNPVTKTGRQLGFEIANQYITCVIALSEQRLVAGAWGNIYASSNGGQSWSSIRQDMPMRFITSLHLSENNTLFVGTNGGLYYRNADLLTDVAEETYSDLHVNIFPNPITRGETASIHSPHDAVTSVRVFDVRGNDVPMSSQIHYHNDKIITLETGRLAPGVYAVAVTSGKDVSTIMLTVQ